MKNTCALKIWGVIKNENKKYFNFYVFTLFLVNPPLTILGYYNLNYFMLFYLTLLLVILNYSTLNYFKLFYPMLF
jgi:uncharacterized membrane-anchored protein YitT (DUF2179 family)